MKRLFRSPFIQSLWEIAGGVSIRVKVLGIVLGIVIVLSALVIAQMRSVLNKRLLLNLEVQGAAIAESIARHVVGMQENGQEEVLLPYLQDRQAHYSDANHNTAVAYILLRDSTGNVTHTIGDVSTAELEHALADLHTDVGTTLWISDEIMEVAVDLPASGAVFHMGFSLSPITETVRTVTLQLFAITVVMVAVGFAAAFFLTWILTRPLLELVRATHAVAQGNFSQRVHRWANDEIGELATAFNEMTASLQEAEQVRAEREAMRKHYVSGVILAQENERHRIARELHDSTSQSLTSLLVGLQNLKIAAADGSINEGVDDLRGVVRQTLDEVRALSWRLRPSTLDDLGLVSALRQYIDEYQERYGIQVDYTASGMRERLPAQIETALYRIVQEGLTNIARYAQTHIASVFLSCRGNVVRIIIEDNGVGFDPTTIQGNKSLGLQGIRERAGLLSGTLTIESQPGQGTSLFIEIPLE